MFVDMYSGLQSLDDVSFQIQHSVIRQKQLWSLAFAYDCAKDELMNALEELDYDFG